MRSTTALALFLAASGFSGSDRAALNLAIAGTRAAPPDLSDLIVRFRKEYLTGVRSAAARLPAADFAKEARALSAAVFARTPMNDVVRRCGVLIGELLAAESPSLRTQDEREAFEKASAGPYRIPGVNATCAAGNPEAVARSISQFRSNLEGSRGSAQAQAARILTDETNLLGAIWSGAGGDQRPARKFDERNGPYTIAGAPR